MNINLLKPAAAKRIPKFNDMSYTSLYVFHSYFPAWEEEDKKCESINSKTLPQS